MALGTDYARQDCSLARTLELVGERWTLLILRDSFFGVRRFSDFQTHLDVSKAVLTSRLSRLVELGLMERVPAGGREEYVLTDAGRALWPSLYALTRWGDTHTSPGGPRRIFSHAACGTDLDEGGACPACGVRPGPEDLEMRPGPGVTPRPRPQPVSVALRSRRRLLEPLRP
jgi:DNA-binding HxlR family transcriptional regulator